MLLAKGLVKAVELVDVLLIDEDPAKGEIVHLVTALLFRLSVWFPAAAVVYVEVDLAVCHRHGKPARRRRRVKKPIAYGWLSSSTTRSCSWPTRVFGQTKPTGLSTGTWRS
ncbi:hypothetical protein [Mesorhizobium silamurunense]|uniref:hypothetical protein n=1 Tax=Mesorhizobium silamurunense TaxID=499528 RepID=UPI00177E38F1|nr:hypothetical protein [Mesorhizobium silamurunense]